MGVGNSTLLKSSRSAGDLDWIAPCSTRTSPAIKHRFTTSFLNRYLGNKLSRIRSRRKQCPSSSGTHRAFRDMINSWSCTELAALCSEMDSGLACKELMALAESARPSTSSISDDLLNIYSDGLITDCFIIHGNKRYAAHSSILRARSRYFDERIRTLWAYKRSTPLELPFIDDSVSEEIFHCSIHYIYSGKICTSLKFINQECLNKLLNKLGCGNSLENDLLNFNFEVNGDCVLIFTASTNKSLSDEKYARRAELKNYQIRCSSTVIAARSKFLSTLVEKKKCPGQTLELVIDERLFPRIYVNVILHAIYTDQIDLSKIMDGCHISANSLNEVQAIAAGRTQRTPLRHAVDIYHIARFLNLSRLAQLCENLMISELTVDTVSNIWTWASEPGGSSYIERQCILYMLKEFSRICYSQSLYELDEEFLCKCLASDFVQCSEVEILESIIRWGEHELVRRMEEREPNLLANTTHSISRKGVRRSELDDNELRNIIKRLLQLVRIDYILPPFHQSLNNAYKRGLLDRSPCTNLLGQSFPDSRSPDVSPDAHWFDPSVPHRHPSGPRMLLSYVVEARNQLRRLCACVDDRFSSYRHMIMKGQSVYGYKTHLQVINTMPGAITEIQRKEVERRIFALLYNDYVQTAFACGCDHHRKFALEQVRLRVVREMDISEFGIEVLYPPICSTDVEFRCYRSQPVLNTIDACSAADIDILMRSSHSEYGNESGIELRPDIICTESTL